MNLDINLINKGTDGRTIYKTHSTEYSMYLNYDEIFDVNIIYETINYIKVLNILSD